MAGLRSGATGRWDAQGTGSTEALAVRVLRLWFLRSPKVWPWEWGPAPVGTLDASLRSFASCLCAPVCLQTHRAFCTSGSNTHSPPYCASSNRTRAGKQKPKLDRCPSHKGSKLASKSSALRRGYELGHTVSESSDKGWEKEVPSCHFSWSSVVFLSLSSNFRKKWAVTQGGWESEACLLLGALSQRLARLCVRTACTSPPHIQEFACYAHSTDEKAESQDIHAWRPFGHCKGQWGSKIIDYAKHTARCFTVTTLWERY